MHTGSAADAARGGPRHLGNFALGGRRAWLALAVIVLVGGMILNWSWLVAVGIAPLLLALAPCAAMCALSLCSKSGGDGCKRQDTTAPPAQMPANSDLDGQGRG